MVAWILAAGAMGAVARYALHRVATSRRAAGFPWGTFGVNVSGSLVLGVVVGLVVAHGVDPDVRTVVGTGFLGAYTTFSAFAYEAFALLEDGVPSIASWYVAGSVVAGLAAAALGLAVTGAL